MSNPQSEMLAIIVGASTFPGSPLLAHGQRFKNSANEIEKYLSADSGLALPEGNILSLFNDSSAPGEQLEGIRSFLASRTKELKGDTLRPTGLLIYYVGHGLFTKRDQTYCLAIRSTTETNVSATSIRAVDLADTVKSYANFVRKYLIIDSCFSASLYKEFQSGPLTASVRQIEKAFPKRGTVMMCSSNVDDCSRAPEGREHTMFSGALLEALRSGHDTFGPKLSFDELVSLVETNLQRDFPETWVRPEVQSPDQRDGDLRNFPLFPNPAFQKSELTRPESETVGAALKSGLTGNSNRVATQPDLVAEPLGLSEPIARPSDGTLAGADSMGALVKKTWDNRAGILFVVIALAVGGAMIKSNFFPSAGQMTVNPRDGLTYVYIPSGTFQMGCSQGDDKCAKPESPRHKVIISKGFWLGETEVPQDAYQRVIGDPNFTEGALPVVKVNWTEAQRYCERVGGLLPTEAQWEYAARAGGAAAIYGNLEQIAWFSPKSEGRSHSVKDSSKKPNAWGVHGMLGNVFEWVLDSYDPNFYGSPAALTPDPENTSSGDYIVLRGGSWNSSQEIVRASSRLNDSRDARKDSIGFRCALGKKPDSK